MPENVVAPPYPVAARPGPTIVRPRTPVTSPPDAPRPAVGAHRRPRSPPKAATRASSRRAKPAKGTALAKEIQQAHDVERVARRLHADWKAALERHEQRVAKQFTELRAALRVKPGREQPAYLKRVIKFRRDLEPKLKPKRGRAKDLRRVEDALGRVLSRLE